MGIWVEIGILLLLVVLNGAFAMSELAIECGTCRSGRAGTARLEAFG